MACILWLFLCLCVCETRSRKKIIHSPICSYLIAGVPFPLSYAAANFNLLNSAFVTVSLMLPAILLFTSRFCFNFPECQIMYKITVYLDCRKNLACPMNHKRDAALLCVSPTEGMVLS